MTLNLLEAATCDNNDVTSGDFRDDSCLDDETNGVRGGVILLSDIVFCKKSEIAKLGVNRVDEGYIGPNHHVPGESDDVDVDEDDDTVSSSSSEFIYAILPVSPSTTISEDDTVEHLTVDSNKCFHPLSKCIDHVSMSLTRIPPVLTESLLERTCDAAAPTERMTNTGSYSMLRITYLLVTLVIMLADGLQGKPMACCTTCFKYIELCTYCIKLKLFPSNDKSGIICILTGTHLYVLYEGYGYSVAYLYCLGFATGGLLSPITGPMVDKIGRKKSAILYCCLEMLINYLEQYPNLYGLIFCRMVGGFTTNLLSSVFETWLDTEYRRRGFAKEKYEIIMRDSVIVSNLAAIFSGYLSHILASQYGTVGPFQGAVTCTTIALIVVCFIWTENYGVGEDGSSKNMMEYFQEAVTAFRDDRKMMIVGILQSLTTGSIQIFVFLWAPTLRHFARHAQKNTWGLDETGEPAYGLIFCAFMAAGVLGGLVAPHIRSFITKILSPLVNDTAPIATIEIEGEGNVTIRPMAVEFLAASCYFLSALLLFVPYVCQDGNEQSFTNTLLALVAYEFLIGIFMPCEGVIRSLYFPTTGRASIMTLPRIVVNVAVALGVVSTSFIRYVLC